MIRTLLLLLLAAQLTFAAIVNYTYDAAGRLTRIDYGSAGAVVYTYDKAGNILTRSTLAGSNAAAITQVKVAWGSAEISPNAWIEIKGTNIVPANTPADGVVWSAAPEFATGHMPTKLSNISVTVNGKPGYVYFFCSAATSPVCKSDQINVLTPLDALPGTAQIVVTNGAVATPPFSVATKATAPSFLYFSLDGYVVAIHANGRLLGPTTLYPGAITPALPGEDIAIYTVGFGLTATAQVEGSSSQFGSLPPAAPTCTVGSTPANVITTLISPGLYQLNLKVPADARNGDNLLNCTYQGVSTQSGALLFVARN